ncbi:amino acid ABC transporter permease [Demequina aurantiaca]|uniref:amino acid ABC transporter permease n=1 Tax=Demequina aurantiaca TaxID=676200 RepID=UPI000782BAEA|nr:amino acid ABC transporter permease [Demequina aurantiaca]
MGALIDNADVVWTAFKMTLWLSVSAGVLSFIWGVMLAAFRVSPIGPLRTFGTVYVNIFRNSPLTLIFLVMLNLAVPVLGLHVGLGVPMAIISLTLYTSTFVCEVVRSGINSVGVGQAEAARSIGLTFFQTLGQIVLPQAFRSVVPPLINVYIAHVKNTSVAAGFAVFELTASAQRLANGNPADVVGVFAGIGLCYLVITIPMGVASQRIERKVAIAR